MSRFRFNTTPKGYYVAFENKEAFEEYEATFPKKEKKIMDGQLIKQLQ